MKNQNLSKGSTAIATKKKTWKNVLGFIFGIVIIFTIIYGINYYYYTNQLNDILNNAINDSANSAMSELKTMNIQYILNSTNTVIPDAQKYDWNELNNGSGKAASEFQSMKFNNDFSDIFKVGKSVKFLQFTRTIGVYTNTNDSSFGYDQYIGNVKVTMTAFYQGYAKNGILYYTETELDDNLQNFINTHKSIQEQMVFEKSFKLVENTIDFNSRTITIYYTWTNLYNETITPMWSFELNAYQNDQELVQDYKNTETGSLIELTPNYTGEYYITYYLQDTIAPVKLVVSNIYGENLFVEDPPTMEFEIEIYNENTIYESIQDEKIFEKSFELVESSVDYYNKTITFYYNWTNLYSEAITPMWSFELNAYQNDIKLNKDYDNSETGSLIELTPNYTGEYYITYYLQDTIAPVKLVVSNIYGENLFVEDPPTMEFEIEIYNEASTSSSFSGDRSGVFGGGRYYSSTQSNDYYDFVAFYQTLQKLQ